MKADLQVLKRILASENAGALLETFERRRMEFGARVRKARRKPTERAIHDVRVAARRLLSMLAVLETLVAKKDLKQLRGIVRDRLQELRKMRDVQVQLLHVEQLLKDFPQLTSFHKFLSKKEERYRARAQQQLKEIRLGRLRRKTDRLLEKLIASIDPEADSVLGRRLAACVNGAFRRVLTLRARIDPELPRSIHRTRLAFKKFRYMAEIVAVSFVDVTDERLSAMHDFQDRMGAIQDIDSLLAAMMSYRRRSGRTSLLVAENELRRRRQRLIDEFLRAADEVRFFWSMPPLEHQQLESRAHQG